MTNENFNPEDYEGKTFKTTDIKKSQILEDSYDANKPSQEPKEFTAVERRKDGGPFSGNNDWLFEQDGEQFSVESKKGNRILQSEKTEEVEE